MGILYAILVSLGVPINELIHGIIANKPEHAREDALERGLGMILFVIDLLLFTAWLCTTCSKHDTPPAVRPEAPAVTSPARPKPSPPPPLAPPAGIGRD